MMSRTDGPTISSVDRPNSRAHAAFQLLTVPSREVPRIASADAETIAAREAAELSAAVVAGGAPGLPCTWRTPWQAGWTSEQTVLLATNRQIPGNSRST